MCFEFKDEVDNNLESIYMICKFYFKAYWQEYVGEMYLQCLKDGHIHRFQAFRARSIEYGSSSSRRRCTPIQYASQHDLIDPTDYLKIDEKSIIEAIENLPDELSRIMKAMLANKLQKEVCKDLQITNSTLLNKKAIAIGLMRDSLQGNYHDE